MHKLISQPTFCELGETVEDHARARDEETRLLDQDRAQSKGLFLATRFKPRRERRTERIRDDEDGVERCPVCAWEIETDSTDCAVCGHRFASEDESEDEETASEPDNVNRFLVDLDPEEEDEDDEYADWAHDHGHSVTDDTHDDSLRRRLMPTGRGPPRRGSTGSSASEAYHNPDFDDYYDNYDEDEDQDMLDSHPGNALLDREVYSEEDEEDEEDDEDDSLNGFIEPDDEDDGESSGSESSEWGSSSGGSTAEAPLRPFSEYGSSRPATPRPDTSQVISDESDSDDVVPRAQNSRLQSGRSNKRPRGPHPIVIDSSDEEDEEDEEPAPRRRRLMGSRVRSVR